MRFPLLRLAPALALLLAAGCTNSGTSPTGTAASTSPAASTNPAPDANAPANMAPSPANDALLAAASPFEDLTEFAEAGDTPGMDRALSQFKQHAEAARTALPAGARIRLDSLVTTIDTSRAAGDRPAVAIGAVEAYRVLIENLDESALAVPRAVSMLDYAGFRTVVLANAAAKGNADWPALAATAREARGFWSSIEGRIDDTALTDAMNTSIAGMEEAAAQKDARLARLAGQVDLDLVDLLEHHFEHAAAPAAG